MGKFTPMIEQYMKAKEENPDALLFFRIGDFYEMFFEDALTASKALEIVLTGRDGGADERIPMCGVPHHAVNNYISRLIQQGFKVAICEQMELPSPGKKLVKREIVRVVTPGTVVEGMTLEEDRNNYLAAVYWSDQAIALAYIDITTGEFQVTEYTGESRRDELLNTLQRIQPSECLINREDVKEFLTVQWLKQPVFTVRFPCEQTKEEMVRSFVPYCENLEAMANGNPGLTTGLLAITLIFDFLRETHNLPQEGSRLRIGWFQERQTMGLDQYSIRNLELVASMRDGRREGSLLGVLDHCSTPMGKRQLRKMILEPLTVQEKIEERLDAVEAFVDDLLLREEVNELLRQVSDMERIAGRISSNIAKPKDLSALKNSLRVLPDMAKLFSGRKPQFFRTWAELDTLEELYHLLELAVNDDAGSDGHPIKRGYHAEIDRLRDLSEKGGQMLLNMEQRERQRTGIRNLKISYNKVFGYYIEISKANLSLVPEDYIRKQTLVNAERFISSELKEFEEQILTAKDALENLERECYQEILRRLMPQVPRILAAAQQVAMLDALHDLAQLAYDKNYVRPRIVKTQTLHIEEGRHPVMEYYLKEERFVPNDLTMTEGQQLGIITGPNMGGKSTFMRQNAIIVLLSQMGSFVPAKAAEIGIVDRIFTRVGASDDLVSGQSTFMVEMVELSNILHYAGKRSFVILDEIGRGTGTLDGLSIAQAVCEYLQERIKARTLFATHFHEITEMGENLPGAFNLAVSVREKDGKVTFLKKVLPGKADRSYGLHVAALAGLPEELLQKAGEKLAVLTAEEKKETEKELDASPKPKKSRKQETAFTMVEPVLWAPTVSEKEEQVLQELSSLSADDLTARQALDYIYRWKERLRK